MEKREFDLITMGEVMLRLSPPRHARITDSSVFEKHAGGAELNVAAGVAQLGLRSAVLTKIPQSPVSAYLKSRIRFMDVSDDFLLFDEDPDVIGTTVNHVKVEDIANLEQIVKERQIHIGIIAVPAAFAQGVADKLVSAGVKGIWNFAPIKMEVPAGMHIVNEDLSVGLSSLSYHITRQ